MLTTVIDSMDSVRSRSIGYDKKTDRHYFRLADAVSRVSG